MGWENAIISVAEIAARIIPLFLAEEDRANGAPGPAWDTGGVRWRLDAQDAVVAENTAEEEIGLLFSKPIENGSLSVMVPIPMHKAAKVTKQIEEYGPGDVAAAPLAKVAGIDGPGYRRVTGCFRYVQVGAAIALLNGIRYRFVANGNVYEGCLETTGPRIRSVEYRMKDTHGNSSSGSAKFEDGEIQGELRFPIASGVELDPMAEEVLLILEIDEDSFEAAVAEQRKLVIDVA